jgi:hypothetical protein
MVNDPHLSHPSFVRALSVIASPLQGSGLQPDLAMILSVFQGRFAAQFHSQHWSGASSCTKIRELSSAYFA